MLLLEIINTIPIRTEVFLLGNVLSSIARTKWAKHKVRPNKIANIGFNLLGQIRQAAVFRNLVEECNAVFENN